MSSLRYSMNRLGLAQDVFDVLRIRPNQAILNFKNEIVPTYSLNSSGSDLYFQEGFIDADEYNSADNFNFVYTGFVVDEGFFFRLHRFDLYFYLWPFEGSSPSTYVTKSIDFRVRDSEGFSVFPFSDTVRTTYANPSQAPYISPVIPFSDEYNVNGVVQTLPRYDFSSRPDVYLFPEESLWLQKIDTNTSTQLPATAGIGWLAVYSKFISKYTEDMEPAVPFLNMATGDFTDPSVINDNLPPLPEAPPFGGYTKP